jgi:NitT/TauT family transport system substrate-binding protein
MALMAFALLGWAAAAPARADVVIAVQYGLAYLPFTIAVQNGMFTARLAAAGDTATKIELLRVSGSSAVNDMIISNSAQLGVLGTPSLLTLWERTRGSLDIKGVAGVSLIPLVLITNQAKIKTAGDFGPNDRIATPSLISPGAFLLEMEADRLFGHAQRTRFSDIIVPLSHPDGLAALLSDTEVTGLFTTAPYSDLALKDHKTHRVTSANDILHGPSDLVVLGTTAGFAKANPKALLAIIDAVAEADSWIVANPEQAAKIYLDSEPSRSLDVATVVSIIKSPENGYDVTPHGIMAYARFMHDNGMLSVLPKGVDDVFLPSPKTRGGD